MVLDDTDPGFILGEGPSGTDAGDAVTDGGPPREVATVVDDASSG